LGAVLTNPLVTAEVIADGIHLDPTVVQLILNLKGPGTAVLITDAVSATGMPDGRYRLGSFEVEVKGKECTSDGRLAGSVLRLDQAVRNVMEFTGRNLQETVQLASANPAAIIGEKCRGVIAAGAQADVLVLSPSGEVRTTIMSGQISN